MVETLERVIEGHRFFEGMKERHIDLISGCAKNVRFEEGYVIFHEGDEANEFYFIREGMVAVELMVPQKGFIRVQTISEEDVLGWSWLVPPYRWRFNARACKSTRALAFDAKCLRTKCEQDHDLGYELLKRFAHVVTERLDATRLQLMDLYRDRA